MSMEILPNAKKKIGLKLMEIFNSRMFLLGIKTVNMYSMISILKCRQER